MPNSSSLNTVVTSCGAGATSTSLAGAGRPPLSRAGTQQQLGTGAGRAAWCPDYTLTAVQDTTYLKVRRDTYSVAVRASRMENRSSSAVWRDEEIDEVSFCQQNFWQAFTIINCTLQVLVKITENDDDFCVRPGKLSVRSPGEIKTTTPAMSRRESVWSTLSTIRSKLGGRSNSSFETCREESSRPWESRARQFHTSPSGVTLLSADRINCPARPLKPIGC